MSKSKVEKYFKKKTKIDIKEMGIDIDKNEYREIVQSNSNIPEKMHSKNNFNSY